MKNLLTYDQLKFLSTRDITPRSICMFPRWGFSIYNKDKECGQISNNPLFKSLDHEYFYVKEITEDGFARGNFYKKPLDEDFYLSLDELSNREILEKIFLSLVCTPYFILKNLWTNRNKTIKEKV